MLSIQESLVVRIIDGIFTAGIWTVAVILVFIVLPIILIVSRFGKK